MPAHLFGFPADMAAIMQIAGEHKLKVIEDAAGAMGSSLNAWPIGTFGDAAAFSFHATKLLTAAGGGVLVIPSDDAALAKAELLSNHGRDANEMRATEFGVNYKMSHLEAALGWAQMRRIEEMLARKRQIAEWHLQRLSKMPGVEFRADPPNARQNYCLITIRFAEELKIDVKQMIADLRNERIAAQTLAPPLNSIPMFQSWQDENPIAYRLARQVILLPSGMQPSRSNRLNTWRNLRKKMNLPDFFVDTADAKGYSHLTPIRISGKRKYARDFDKSD